MFNNSEFVILMLKKSLILITLFFVIVAIPSKAESVAQSLEKLIEQNKVTAIKLAKKYIKAHLKDSLKEYKNQLKRLDYITFRYVPDVSLRKEYNTPQKINN